MVEFVEIRQKVRGLNPYGCDLVFAVAVNPMVALSRLSSSPFPTAVRQGFLKTTPYQALS